MPDFCIRENPAEIFIVIEKTVFTPVFQLYGVQTDANWVLRIKAEETDQILVLAIWSIGIKRVQSQVGIVTVVIYS